jgi:glycine/D-amino acid oxidase-like deaminating enzyme
VEIVSDWITQTVSNESKRSLSLWWDQLSEAEVAFTRPALSSDLNVDVAIVGGGYTGLWTAYWTKKNNPELSVAIFEREVVGFGASGRNGGWCSSYFSASVDKIARESSREAALDLLHAMHEIVDEVGLVVATENIDCDWQKGGILMAIRTPEQLLRARQDVEWYRSWGMGPEDFALLTAEEAATRIGTSNLLGATFTPHSARIQPAKLVRGLAHVVERMGVSIFEYSTVESITPRKLQVNGKQVTTNFIIRATEGYTAQLKGLKREVAPVYSLMLASEPLPDHVWQQIGLTQFETFADMRHLVIYGQRTADNRIAFGGRGAPYHFGSSIKPDFDRDPKVHQMIWETLVEMFPVLENYTYTHSWGGPLGISRDWYSTVGLDPVTGIGWGGGYVGDGVGTSALAGHTLADLITGTESFRTRLPWVNRRSRRWEFEPLRWIGANLGLKVMTAADREEKITGKPSRAAAIFGKLLGQ